MSSKLSRREIEDELLREAEENAEFTDKEIDEENAAHHGVEDPVDDEVIGLELEADLAGDIAMDRYIQDGYADKLFLDDVENRYGKVNADTVRAAQYERDHPDEIAAMHAAEAMEIREPMRVGDKIYDERLGQLVPLEEFDMEAYYLAESRN